MCSRIFTQSIGATEMEVGNLVSDCVNTDKRCANNKQFAHPTLAGKVDKLILVSPNKSFQMLTREEYLLNKAGKT